MTGTFCASLPFSSFPFLTFGIVGVVIEIVFGVLTLYDRDFGTFFFGYFLVVPMLLTNVVATSTVGIKAWCVYRHAIWPTLS